MNTKRLQVPLEKYLQLLEEQGGRCAICRISEEEEAEKYLGKRRGRPSVVDVETMEKLKEMKAAGKSTRVASRELGLAHSTVGRAMRRCEGTAPRRWLYTDHDHKTGELRGLLCSACNCLLGFSRDRPGVLFAAINYLRENGQTLAIEGLEEPAALPS